MDSGRLSVGSKRLSVGYKGLSWWVGRINETVCQGGGQVRWLCRLGGSRKVCLVGRSGRFGL